MYFNKNNNFYHGIMFHHFHGDGIHSKGQGSIDKDDFYKMINFIGRNNILDADVFLEKNGHKCFGTYSQIDYVSERPFFAYQNVRNLKRSKPRDCKLIKIEKYNYTFSSKDVVTGKLWYCE